jgi:hypothetical protein
MPNFNRDALKTGAAAIREANESNGGGGDFKPYLPSIFWKDDGDEHFVLILNPIDEIPCVDFHPFIVVEEVKYGLSTIARTDSAIGERTDAIQDKWAYKPRKTNLMIAVELEATFKDVEGRKRPAGFEVKVNEFERRIRDEKSGELTEEREAVVAPAIGLIAQSAFNFGNKLESYDGSEGPIHKTALKIKKIGKKTNTDFTVVGYENVDIDLSNLVDFIDNVSYIQKPETLVESIDGLDDFEAAAAIGSYVLDLKLEELADEANYEEILAQITKPNPWAKDDKKDEKAARPARPAQRRQRTEKPSAEVEPEVDADVTPEPEVTRTSDAKERLAKLRNSKKVAA